MSEVIRRSLCCACRIAKCAKCTLNMCNVEICPLVQIAFKISDQISMNKLRLSNCGYLYFTISLGFNRTNWIHLMHKFLNTKIVRLTMQILFSVYSSNRMHKCHPIELYLSRGWIVTSSAVLELANIKSKQECFAKKNVQKETIIFCLCACVCQCACGCRNGFYVPCVYHKRNYFVF